MSSRRLAREIAVQALYEIEQSQVAAGIAIASNCERRDAPPEACHYTQRLVHAVAEHRDELRQRLSAALQNWSWERVALVDRCILEVGAVELLHFTDVPLAVSLDEAVRVARKFSTDESGAFVNGVLDRLARDIRSAETSTRPDS